MKKYDLEFVNNLTLFLRLEAIKYACIYIKTACPTGNFAVRLTLSRSRVLNRLSTILAN